MEKFNFYLLKGSFFFFFFPHTRGALICLKFVAIYPERKERTRRELAQTFMMPFQLSPVDTLKRVRKAMPKLVKVACRLRPSHGFSSLQSAGERSGSTSVKPSLAVLLQSCTHGPQNQGGWLRGEATVVSCSHTRPGAGR